MAYRVLNKSDDLLCIPLTTGEGYYLAPGQERLDFPDSEAETDAAQALLVLRVVYLEAIPAPPPAG